LNPHYEQIVVGSSLRALLYASLHELPVFFTKPDKPKPFELFSPSVDLSSFGLENTLRFWETPEGQHQTGDYKIHLWEHLLFVLGLKGLAPFSDMCDSLRLDDDCLTGYSEYAKLRSVDFDVCHYFDDAGRYNLLATEEGEAQYKVYDRIAFMRGGKHKYDLITTGDDFCDSIWFYPTPRVDGKTAIKDACAISILSVDQLDDFDFSETMARLTTLETMKDLGDQRMDTKKTDDHDIAVSKLKRSIARNFCFLLHYGLKQIQSKLRRYLKKGSSRDSLR